MLLRSGWNEHQGLGSRGDGKKYPVKTQLKRDRKGIGADPEKNKTSRITHFEPNDQHAVAQQNIPGKRTISAKKAAKYAMKKKKRKAQRLERELRYEFSN